MCGIVGYTGYQEAAEIILEGLRHLKYRGYDSAGIATLHDGQAEIRRARGKLRNLERLLQERPVTGCCGIGHTRWATHGRPSEINAHPHRSGEIILVHNGIIENYAELKKGLVAQGYSLQSETDTEILAHLIHFCGREGGSLEEAVRRALLMVRGSYAIAVASENEPGVLVAARCNAPLVVGRGEGESFIASDIPAILAYTREMAFLEDNEIAVVTPERIHFSTLEGKEHDKTFKTVSWTLEMAEKGGYRHFMLKEIFEQPRALGDTLSGRVTEEGELLTKTEESNRALFVDLEKIVIVACGTSWHAGLVGRYFLEKYLRIPVEVDIASEFRYRDPVLSENTLAIFISQSGETADTLAALRCARERHARIFSICNVVDSSIVRESDGVFYTHAGPEIGVASTKAFTTQLVSLFMLGIHMAVLNGRLEKAQAAKLVMELVRLPRLAEITLQLADSIESIAREFKYATDFLYLGRGNQYPIALEGALKLKEISYIHAEGYPSGEMKHGPIALIDKQMPVVMLAPHNAVFEKTFSNMEEVRARGGHIIVITDQEDTALDKSADAVLTVPEAHEDFLPVLTIIPLQLLAYHIAVLKGADVDQPRNLAKSVTVE